MISEVQLIQSIEAKNQFPLDSSQVEAIRFGLGPLLIAAGPGTGKTEVLVARCLKLMCCDGVPPASIMITTFTEKAAKNLQDRLATVFLFLCDLYPNLTQIDPADLRIGTIHSICVDVMQEYRFVGYQNLRLLDGVECALLIHKEISSKKVEVNGARVGLIDHLKPMLFAEFGHLFANKPQAYLSDWDWAHALQSLVSRAVEDRLDVALLRNQGQGFNALADILDLYDNALLSHHATDFSRLLKHFVEFLLSGQGAVFLAGDGTQVRLPLTHVLVDEYQDTNPIQEEIYLRLADAVPHNITVVGDDDQALYRFRGGTVECIVGFPDSASQRWGVATKVMYLSINHRSDERIVTFCSDYISEFPLMQVSGVRIAGKPPLASALGETGNHPAVSHLRESTVSACAKSFATLVLGLHSNGVIQDFSQCVLLLRSAKNSDRFAGPFINALHDQGIPVYNPRSKDFLEQEEVSACLGALVRILDPNLNNLPVPQTQTSLTAKISNLVQSWDANYSSVAVQNDLLAQYVQASQHALSGLPANYRVTPALPTILFRILSLPPFTAYQSDPERDLRLSKLTRLFESFCAQYGRELKTDMATAGTLPGWWYHYFYRGFCGYLALKGMDDDEDEEVVCPSGYFPIMTVHQAKGLEFDFVFVANLGTSVSESDSHRLEEQLRPFRLNQPSVIHAPADACWHDEIRQHFVAFSRAKYALVLIATDGQLRKTGQDSASFGFSGGKGIRQQTPRL